MWFRHLLKVTATIPAMNDIQHAWRQMLHRPGLPADGVTHHPPEALKHE